MLLSPAHICNTDHEKTFIMRVEEGITTMECEKGMSGIIKYLYLR